MCVMCGCRRCCATWAILLLIAGFLFLLVDVGVWDFWNLQWWTVLFLLIAVTGLAMGNCKDCQAIWKGRK